MKLYLTRHGETLFNKMKLSQGWCDSPLTEIGVKQGEYLGEVLKDVTFRDIYTSTSERSVDTANLINSANNNPTEIIETKLLKEVNFGMLEATPDPLRMNLLRKDPDNFTFLYELKQGYKAYNGDSYEDVLNRVKEILDIFETKYQNEDYVLFVAHGGILRIIMDYLFGSERPELTRTMPNACCIVLEYKDCKYNYIQTIENIVSRETI